VVQFNKTNEAFTNSRKKKSKKKNVSNEVEEV
jgi:hypothetical protein